MPIYHEGKALQPGIASISAMLRDEKATRGDGISHRKWDITSSTLREVEKWISYPIGEFVAGRAKGGGAPVVVDWGCGKGVAISELARDNPTARCYGFGKDFYSSWLRTKNVDFIHAEAEQFFNYFKDGSIDLLYSSAAIEHLWERLPDYVRRLVPKLTGNGVMALELPPYQIEEVSEVWAMRLGFDVEMEVMREGFGSSAILTRTGNHE